MEQSINIYQTNSEGDNYFSIDPSDKVFRPYEKELSVGEEKIFLDDASENLIRDGRLHLNEDYIKKVTQYLDDRKFCLIKAPEGRGKTYLSRIIAYNYHHNRGMEVYFLEMKYNSGIPVNGIDDILKEWHKNSKKDYLIVIENVHVYEELEALRELIKGWINPKGNRFRFLLNARPTDLELEVFSQWEEKVELIPNNKDVNDIINLFSKEVGREPFADAKERKSFVNKIYQSKEKASGANLRLLKIYLETWQLHPEIEFISGVSEKTVNSEFRRLYLAHRTNEEVEALWFVSSLYQFDAPLHEDIVQDVGELVKDGLLRFENNKYHLPHSVDASFLYKSICGYKGKDSVAQMKIFAVRFVKKVLDSDSPRDFENDFRLLVWGLVSRKDEFQEVTCSLTCQDMAEKIIKEIFPGFVLTFFRPENHNDSHSKELIQYYEDNKNWLKPLILVFTPYFLCQVYRTFKKYLGYSNFLKAIFVTTEELEDYMNANDSYKVFLNSKLLGPIVVLGAEYKNTLQKHYEKNKALLKPFLLEYSPISLFFVYRSYKKDMHISILKDIFSDPKELEDYLSANDNIKVFLQNQLWMSIVELGAEYRTILQEHYEKNKGMLKPFLLRLSPTSLVFIIKAFKKQLSKNIVKDIFSDPKELADYLSVNENYKLLLKNELLAPLVYLGLGYRTILQEYYEKNKALLKPLFLADSPTKLFYVRQTYLKHLNINIVKDIFNDVEDLEEYMKKNDKKVFPHDDILKDIQELGDDYKRVLEIYNAFVYFFYPTRSTKKGFYVNQSYIQYLWENKLPFDVSLIRNNRFYFNGVSWAYIHKFVYIIKESMTEGNRQQSIGMVRAIVEKVLAKENSLSYATAIDLSYFYYNISLVDEAIFQELMENNAVQADIKRRLQAVSYSAGDLYLFNLVFSQSWCKTILESRIQNADEAQQEIIDAWHDEIMNKQKDRGEEIISGSLLEYIHRNS